MIGRYCGTAQQIGPAAAENGRRGLDHGEDDSMAAPSFTGRAER
jgi:hypothetical protein